MPRFSYVAFDRSGRESTGMIESAGIADACVALKERGLFPSQIREGSPGAHPLARRRGGSRPCWRRAIPRREVTSFVRQLAALLKAGMPAVRGLEILARQEGNAALRQVVLEVAADVRGGASLFAAFQRHDKLFDTLSVNLIRAGEAAGALDVVLERLARFFEKSLTFRAKVTSALVYPLVVLGVAVLILSGLMVFVVPKFQQIFADLLKGAPLPPLTQAVLTVSQFMRDHWTAAVAIMVAGAIAARVVGARLPTMRVVDAAVLRLPLIGELLLKAQCVRFARTLGTLTSGGVAILDALEITRTTAGSARVAAAIQQIHDRVKGGHAIAPSIEATTIFPPLVASMVEVGEQTGQLADMLNRIAEIYEDDVDRTAASLTALVEPMLIFALAIVVGTIVIALFLPIVRMVQLLS